MLKNHRKGIGKIQKSSDNHFFSTSELTLLNTMGDSVHESDIIIHVLHKIFFRSPFFFFFACFLSMLQCRIFLAKHKLFCYSQFIWILVCLRVQNAMVEGTKERKQAYNRLFNFLWDLLELLRRKMAPANNSKFIFETERCQKRGHQWTTECSSLKQRGHQLTVIFLSLERPPANDIMFIFETKRSEKYNVQIPYLPILKWNFSFLLTNSCGQGR